MREYFKDDIDDEIIISLVKKVEFQWNFHAFKNHLEPEANLRKACKELLTFSNGLTNKDKENIISTLYEKICHCSSVPKNTTNFTLKTFNEITGLNIIDNIQKRKIEDYIGKEKLDFLESLNPNILRLRDVYDNGVITYIYIQFENKKKAIGIIDDYKSEENIIELWGHISKLKEIKPILILQGKRIQPINLPVESREYIINNDQFEQELTNE